MADAPSRRPSILSTIMRIESGGRNIPQNIDDINMRRGTPAQGYFQIITPTWSEFGGDKTGSKSALDAPYATQLQVAQNIPVARWGPNTQAALRAAGYEPKPGETLGQMLTRYGEDPTATKPEDLGGSTVVAAAPAAATLPAGLLGASTPAPATSIDGAKVDKEKEEAAAYASLTREGQKIMAAEEPEAPPPVQPASVGGLLQASTEVPLPDFTKPAPTLPDFLEMLSQQRLRRA
jgi:hypothetical protein